MRLLERDDGEVILIILLIKLAEEPPGLRALLMLLHLRFKAENRLLDLTLLDELLRLVQQALAFELFGLIFIVLLEDDLILDGSTKLLGHLSLLVPDLIPLAH